MCSDALPRGCSHVRARRYIANALARDKVGDDFLNGKGIRALRATASDILGGRQFDGILIETAEAAGSSARLARKGKTPLRTGVGSCTEAGDGGN